MKAKDLLPYERYTLQTRLTVEEVRQRLEDVIAKEEGRWFKTWQRVSYKPYRGILQNNTFEITRIIDYRNSFLPVIKGSFYAAEGQTRLDVKLTLSTGVHVFMIFWLGIVGIVCLCMLAAFLTDIREIFTKGISFPVFIPFIMFIFGCCLTFFAFKTESGKTKTFLTDLVNGKELTDLS